MNTNGKRLDLHQLQAELAAAGIAVPSLGLRNDGAEVHTYTAGGAIQDLPAGAAAVIAAHTPPPPIVGSVGEATIARRARTTNATPAEVWRAPLAPTTGYWADLRLVGIDAGNGVLRAIWASVLAKRLGGGALLVGAPVVLANHQDTGAAAITSNVVGWAITAAVSGNDFVVTVTGATGRTVDWLLRGTVASFAPGDGT